MIQQHSTNESQQMLNRNIHGIGYAVRFFIYLFIFLPLLAVASLFTTKVLDKKTEGIYQVAAIVVMAYLIYCILFFLKGMLMFWKRKLNPLWIIIWMICTAFTCLPSALLLFNVIHHHVPPFLAYSFSAIAGSLIYLHYMFHLDWAPFIARFAYHSGVYIAWLFRGGRRRNQ